MKISYCLNIGLKIDVFIRCGQLQCARKTVENLALIDFLVDCKAQFGAIKSK